MVRWQDGQWDTLGGEGHEEMYKSISGQTERNVALHDHVKPGTRIGPGLLASDGQQAGTTRGAVTTTVL